MMIVFCHDYQDSIRLQVVNLKQGPLERPPGGPVSCLQPSSKRAQSFFTKTIKTETAHFHIALKASCFK